MGRVGGEDEWGGWVERMSGEGGEVERVGREGAWGGWVERVGREGGWRG